MLQSGNHEDLARVMADKERQQQTELEAVEAEFEAEEAEQTQHVTKNANDELTNTLKDKQKDLLTQVQIAVKNFLLKHIFLFLIVSFRFLAPQVWIRHRRSFATEIVGRTSKKL